MLRRRVVAALVVREGIVVQSLGFSRFLPVGRPEIAAEFLNQWGVDEILLVDISATRNATTISAELVRRVSRACFVPLTVGGGIRRVEDIDALLQAGADKVSLNRVIHERPELVTTAARKFGDQCIVASLDVKSDGGGPRIYDYLTGRCRHQDPVELARHVQGLGAGEILLNAVDRDGAGKGFDVAMNAAVSAAVTIPVIAMGGAGHPAHFPEVFDRTGVRAACAGNFFHYTEHSVVTTKAELVRRGQRVRLETKATYADAEFDPAGRLSKKPDDVLERLLYVRIEKEVI
jgi:cyclase